jgi:hypothetical protein
MQWYAGDGSSAKVGRRDVRLEGCAALPAGGFVFTGNCWANGEAV